MGWVRRYMACRCALPDKSEAHYGDVWRCGTCFTLWKMTFYLDHPVWWKAGWYLKWRFRKAGFDEAVS